MPTLASFLIGIVGTLAGRVLLALGIGFVSYAGVGVALNAVRGRIETAWSNGGTIFDILYLAGMGEAVGILLAAFSVRAAMFGIQRLAKVAS